MKRFHVNLTVAGIPESVRFHTALFEAAIYRADTGVTPTSGACCVPLKASTESCCDTSVEMASACCS
jgi:hypothetical protein